MATTLSSPPTSSQSVLTDNMSEGAYRRTRRIGGRVPILIGLGVVVVATAGWGAMSWTRSAGKLAAIEQMTLVPRSFAVVLKEKGELKAVQSTDIKCEVEGRSTIISLVEEGTAVKEGDLLVELASDQIDERIQTEELKESNTLTAYEAATAELEIQRDKNASDIRKADLQIELKKLEMEKYELGDWVQQERDAHIDIEQAEITRKRRKQDYEAAQELLEKGFTTQTEFDEADFNYRRAEWELEKAKRALKVLQEYTHKADHRQRESDLEEALKERGRVVRSAAAEETKRLRAVEGKKKELDLIRDKLAKLRTQKEKCRITAPNPGFVVYYSGGGRHFMSSENQIKEGATVYERQVLMQLPDTSRMIVAVRIHEAKTDKIKLGQPTVVEVEGLPGKQFTGTVTRIAVVADSQNRWLNPDLKEYETEITLDASDDPLKPGATAHVEILVQTVENVVAVPVQTVYTKAGQRYVFRKTGEKIEPVKVTLGAIATEWAQVVEGLSEGDEIALAVSDEHKRLLPDLPLGDRANGRGSYGPRRPNRPQDQKHGKTGRSKPADPKKRVGP